MRSCKDGHALRTVVSAVAIVCLALAFHAAAGGPVPDPTALGLLTLATLTVTAPLTRRAVPLPGLLLVLGAAQLVLHTAFDAHGHGAMAAHGHGAASGAAMVTMHAAATALTALVFAQGRDALRHASAWTALRHLLLHPCRPLPAPPRLPALAIAPTAGASAVPTILRGRAPPPLVPPAVQVTGRRRRP